jgi:hypothetical protein
VSTEPEIVYFRAARTDQRGRNADGEGWLYRIGLRFPEGDRHDLVIGEGWSLGWRRAVDVFAADRRRLWAELQAAVLRLAWWWV